MTNKIKVLFLLKSVNGATPYWDCFSGISRYLKAQTDFEVKIFLVPDFDWSDLAKAAPLDALKEVLGKIDGGAKILDDPDDRLRAIQKECPDYIFITSSSPSYSHYCPGLRFRDLRSLAKLCYVPYGAVTVTDHPNGEIWSWHSKIPNIKNSTLIFCDTEVLRKILIENGYSKEALYHFSHLKLLSIRQDYAAVRADTSKMAKKGRTIGISHHNSILGNPIASWNFGVFDKVKEIWLNEFKTHGENIYLFRPHPLLELCYDTVYGAGSFKRWIREASAWPNFLDGSKLSTAEYFATIDVLVTDGISYLTEFPIITGKPYIFLESHARCALNEVGDLALKGAARVRDFRQLPQSLRGIEMANLIATDTERLELRKMLEDEFLPDEQNAFPKTAELLRRAMISCPKGFIENLGDKIRRWPQNFSIQDLEQQNVDPETVSFSQYAVIELSRQGAGPNGAQIAGTSIQGHQRQRHIEQGRSGDDGMETVPSNIHIFDEDIIEFLILNGRMDVFDNYFNSESSLSSESCPRARYRDYLIRKMDLASVIEATKSEF